MHNSVDKQECWLCMQLQEAKEDLIVGFNIIINVQ